MRKTGVGMDYLVLRKLLSTTSLLAMAASLAACSGEVDRFGAPGTGYTSNQNEIFTSSVRSQPIAAPAYQPMPAAVPVGSGGQPTVYSDPSYQAQVSPQPVYSSPAYSEPAAVATRATVPSYNRAEVQSAPVALTTGSINRSASTMPSSQSYPMPPMPTATTGASASTVYVDVPEQPSSASYRSSASANQAVLNGPPVVISRFASLPQTAPRAKTQGRYTVASNSYNQVPVSVPVANQPVVQQQDTGRSRFSFANLFSLPKNAPRSKGIDYTSTASITPPAPIPTSGQSDYGYGNQSNQTYRAPVQAPSYSSRNVARTSGQWTSVGGTMVTVEQGEDVQSLSRRYGVPEKAISDINDLKGRNYVAPGQRLLIPVFQQQGYETYASNRQQTMPAGQPMQLSSVVPAQTSSVDMPYVMRVPKGNPLRLRSQSAYGRQAVQLQQSANAENRHMVNPGETLGGIASRYGVSTSALAQANGMSVNSPLRMGQRLHIPQGSQAAAIDYTTTASIGRSDGGLSSGYSSVRADVPTISATPKAKPRWVQEMARSSAAQPSSRQVNAVPERKSQKVASLNGAVGLPNEETAPQASSSVRAAPVQSVAVQSNDANSGVKFRWPVRGRIISNFGNSTGGVRNEGINLAVPEGASVRAADDGTVIYAGDDLKMYGNFILVRHQNGWVTAYAHNSNLMVRKGQIVRRGQIIAEAGKSGNVSAPQVHFELRIKGDPVDPVPYLS